MEVKLGEVVGIGGLVLWNIELSWFSLLLLIVCDDVVVVLSNVDFVLQSRSLFVNGIAVTGRVTMSGTERRFVLGKGGPF